MRLLLLDLKAARKYILIISMITAVCLGIYKYAWRGNDIPAFYGAPIYQGSNTEKEMALTVNVFWGEEYIPQMLSIFEENKVRATFFIGGTWAEKFPDLTKDIAVAGHEIGSHGYSHPHPDRLSKGANIREMQRAEDVIYKVTGQRPKLFAPPYGEHGPTVLQASREAGYKTILWTIDTIDWQRPEPHVLSDRVLSKASNGAIVLMHPTAPTIKALPVILEELRDRGYRLVTVSEMLEKIKVEQSNSLPHNAS